MEKHKRYHQGSITSVSWEREHCSTEDIHQEHALSLDWDLVVSRGVATDDMRSMRRDWIFMASVGSHVSGAWPS